VQIIHLASSVISTAQLEYELRRYETWMKGMMAQEIKRKGHRPYGQFFSGEMHTRRM
jgi:hypothetical protein